MWFLWAICLEWPGPGQAVAVFAHGLLSTGKWELAACSCLGPACLPADQLPCALARWCLAKLCSEVLTHNAWCVPGAAQHLAGWAPNCKWDLMPSPYKIALREWAFFCSNIDYFSVMLAHSNNVLLWILLIVLAGDLKKIIFLLTRCSWELILNQS